MKGKFPVICALTTVATFLLWEWVNATPAAHTFFIVIGEVLLVILAIIACIFLTCDLIFNRKK